MIASSLEILSRIFLVRLMKGYEGLVDERPLQTQKGMK
jgi:hypothetical protein